MDLAKRGRSKVTVGDCVSINSTYFGKAYANELGVEKLYGRVVGLSANSNFSVKWDFDGVVSKHMTLDKVTLEERDTPKQGVDNSVVTTEDYQTADQGTSNEASSTHAILVEDYSSVDFDSVADGNTYILLSGNVKCFVAKMYSTKPGTCVHHKKLLESQRKFLIDEVLDTTWEGFNEDLHCIGSFVAWNLEDTAVVVEREVEEDSKKKKKRKFELKLILKGFEKDGEEEEEENKENEREEDESSETDEDVKRIKRMGAGRRSRRRGGRKSNKVSKNKKEENSTKKKKENSIKKKKEQKEGQKKVVKQQEKVQEKTVGDRSNRRKKSLGNSNRGAKQVEKIQEEDSKEEDSSTSSSSIESEEEVDKDEQKKAEKLKDQTSAWKKGGWTINPCDRHPYGPKLHLEGCEIVDELSFLLHFVPVAYIQDVVLEATNDYASKNVPNFENISYAEFITFLGLVYSMEVVKLPERRMYWRDNKSDLFPNMDFGKHMPRNRFQEILAYLQFSFAEDKTAQVLEFLDAVNDNLDKAISPGQFVCVDESMIKAFHHDLPGKIKIKRKPRPIGNEIKDMSDASSMIVIRMELYEGKDPMSTKEHVHEYGATCATTLRLAESIKSSGRIVIGDSWFGSIKTAIQLRKIGLFAIMLVKTAHANYPRELLNSHQLARGEWIGYTRTMDDVGVMAVSFQDLKKKQFISTCETVVAGKPRATKHHGDVPRPKVAETYLKHADSIDKHNAFRTGSLGLEDVLHTHSPHLRQFFGILGFLFTNAYLAYRFFKPEQSTLKHLTFKMVLAESMVKFKESVSASASLRIRSPLPFPFPAAAAVAANAVNDDTHTLDKLTHQKPCYYCRHGYAVSQKINTTFKCSSPLCDVPYHKPSFVHRRKDGTTKVLNCWKLHLIHGKPQYRRVMDK